MRSHAATENPIDKHRHPRSRPPRLAKHRNNAVHMAPQQTAFADSASTEASHNPRKDMYHIDFNRLFFCGRFLRTLQKAKHSQAVASPLQNQPTDLSTAPVEQKNLRKTGHLPKRNSTGGRPTATARCSATRQPSDRDWLQSGYPSAVIGTRP